MSTSELVREAACGFAHVRRRPCLVLNTPLETATIRTVRDVLGDHAGPIDVVLRSPGGCACCAYAVARELRRRGDDLAVFVPHVAKSAATLLALAADELVLGDLGELGPLDAQFAGKQQADFPVDHSHLDRLLALKHMKKFAASAFDDLRKLGAEGSGLRGEDVYRIAVEFAGRVSQAVCGPVEPEALGAGLRALEVGKEYADRLLRRYRPDLYARRGQEIIGRLVWGYPAHGFVIDREEMQEIGLPVRAPTADEAPALARLDSAMRELGGDTAIAWTAAPAETDAAPPLARDGVERQEPEAQAA